MRSSVTLCISALIILSSLFTIGPMPAHADVPDSINYSGVLSSGGLPVADGNYNVTFGLYDVASGPDPSLWTETKSVTTVDGIFNTFLGSVTALPSSVFSGPNRWLGMAVSPDAEMTPRTAIVAVPYAYRIATVDGATGGSISGNVNLDPSTASSGNILKGGIPFIHDFGTENVFIGLNAGNLTMTGTGNTASGRNALLNNTEGSGNTASGYYALQDNTTGYRNTASGVAALQSNTAGRSNTANGANTLLFNTAGDFNTANGSGALGNNTIGYGNTAIGASALGTNFSGSYNTAVGFAAGVAGTDLTNATAIGPYASVSASDAMVFGNTAVTKWGFGVNPGAGRVIEVGTNTSNGDGAYLTTGGTWTNTSDRSVKEGIALVDGHELLEKVNQLPVYRWNYIGEDPSHQHVGPMAQDFHAVFGLGDDDKHISTIDPAGVALAAIQALNQRLNEQAAENEQLREQITELREMIRAPAANRK